TDLPLADLVDHDGSGSSEHQQERAHGLRQQSLRAPNVLSRRIAIRTAPGTLDAAPFARGFRVLEEPVRHRERSTHSTALANGRSLVPPRHVPTRVPSGDLDPGRG